MAKRLPLKVVGISFLMWFSCWVAAAELIIHPPSESSVDGRDAYPIRLLGLALGKSGKAYTLKAYPQFMLQGRAMAELEGNRGLDVIWTMTSADRETRLLPIRIPIDKGLLGWRLLMVKESALPRFASIGVDKLRQLHAGQGHDWPDTEILQSAGFDVKVTSEYRALFQMLSNGSIDYFPRSAQEVWQEVGNNRDLKLTVEPTLALHYPAAMYFFVNRKNVELAETIRRGLEAAIADGSFERLFREHFASVIARANLEGRNIIDMPNPLLPAATPLNDKRYWLQVKPKAAVTNLLPR